MKHIQSRDNPQFKQLRRLATSSRARRDEKTTLIDGIHLYRSCLEAGLLPRLTLVAQRAVDQMEIAGLIARQPGEAIVLGDALFDELSPTDTPTGLLAVIDIPETPMTSPTGDCLVLDAVQDSGNLGTLLRAAWATGVPDVLLTPGCAQAWSPKVLRAGQGAHFGLRIREQCDLADSLQDYPGKIVATRLDATRSLFALDLRGPVAWLFGNEGAGLSPSAGSLATDAVRIPMPGAAESLNVAMAATVCLFEQVRQRQSA
ncbi:MAG: RNA methyltransferase [Methyloversatilis sp.]|nr:RNA methyltransferase [Methyloversatilis sp.]MBP6193200.1 RNA methyltransferase [Methyloversatilis sp.]MBP9117633.1 RNA methyltransferase [Methyloversatilis sp.]